MNFRFYSYRIALQKANFYLVYTFLKGNKLSTLRIKARGLRLCLRNITMDKLFCLLMRKQVIDRTKAFSQYR